MRNHRSSRHLEGRDRNVHLLEYFIESLVAGRGFDHVRGFYKRKKVTRNDIIQIVIDEDKRHGTQHKYFQLDEHALMKKAKLSSPESEASCSNNSSSQIGYRRKAKFPLLTSVKRESPRLIEVYEGIASRRGLKHVAMRNSFFSPLQIRRREESRSRFNAMTLFAVSQTFEVPFGGKMGTAEPSKKIITDLSVSSPIISVLEHQRKRRQTKRISVRNCQAMETATNGMFAAFPSYTSYPLQLLHEKHSSSDRQRQSSFYYPRRGKARACSATCLSDDPK